MKTWNAQQLKDEMKDPSNNIIILMATPSGGLTKMEKIVEKYAKLPDKV